jgi:hypothetical protein
MMAMYCSRTSEGTISSARRKSVAIHLQDILASKVES